MLLYKFKSLSCLEHVIDLLMQERLFCCEYEHLNDPFEGQFLMAVPQPILFLAGAAAVGSPLVRHTMPASVPMLPVKSDRTRVCSLTCDPHDVRMWSLYADGHKGVAVEIDFSGLEASARAVTYTKNLQMVGSTLLGSDLPDDVLTRKTEHWSYESEYRVLSSEPYFHVAGRIKRVIMGFRAEPAMHALLARIAPEGAEVVRASLDHDGAAIRV